MNRSRVLAFVVATIVTTGLAAYAGSSALSASASPAHQAGVHPFLTAISFANANDGWVSGHTESRGYLFHTTNAGRTWTKQSLNWAADQMEFISPSSGWAVVESPARCGA